MIRITVAEGLKRMYKEYRLKQWRMLLDKAATLRRLLESEVGLVENDDSRAQPPENSEIPNQLQAEPTGQVTTVSRGNQQFPSASRDNLQYDWQMAAPEAYHWYPVTDFQTRMDTSGAGNLLSSPRFSNSFSGSSLVIHNAETSTTSATVIYPTPSMQTDSTMSQHSATSSMDCNRNDINQTGSPCSSFQTMQQTNSQGAGNRRNTLDMDSLNEVVEEMEASFNEIEDMLNDFLHDVFNNDLADSYHQNETNEQPQMILPPLLSPEQERNQSTRNAESTTGRTPPANISRQQINMTSSSSPRVLENMNHSNLLVNTMNANASARTQLLWRDDPPAPADDPPRVLSWVTPHNFLGQEASSETVEANPDGTANQEPGNTEPTAPHRPADAEEMESDANVSFQSDVSWESSADSNDIDTLPGILYAAERLGPMDQSIHMDIEMGDFGIGHLLFDRAAGTWATSHCEFHRSD